MLWESERWSTSGPAHVLPAVAALGGSGVDGMTAMRKVGWKQPIGLPSLTVCHHEHEGGEISSVEIVPGGAKMDISVKQKQQKQTHEARSQDEEVDGRGWAWLSAGLAVRVALAAECVW